MRLAFAWARRELRSGVKGFRIFLACLALGVAAIAAAGSTAEAFRRGLASEAREILGGDLSVTIQGRRFGPEETAVLRAAGRTTDTVRVRAMAQAPSGARRLVEARGVDPAFPLAGVVGLQGAASLREALAARGGVPGAAVEPALMDRLGLKIGDLLLIGDARFVVTAVLTHEPDRLGGGFAVAPRVMVARGAVEQARLLEADSFFAETVRIAIAPEADVFAAEKALEEALPEAGAYRIRNRTEAASGLRRLIDRLEFFLGFIGLSSLVAGGLGVSSAVASYLEARKPSIAVLKALGAEAPLIRNVFLIQIGALAALGVGIGLVVGAAAPVILGRMVQDQLTVPALFAVYPAPLLKAGAFGLLAAATFALVPLARARATPPSVLFRKDLAGRLSWSPETVGAVLAAGGLVALSVASAPRASIAAGMVAVVAVGFGVLWLLGRGAATAASRLRRFARGAVRMGLANLAGPASAGRTAAPAIGLGVALLAAIVLIQSSLLSQIRDVAPKSAPALIFTQVPPERAEEFDAAVAAELGPLTPDTYRRNGVGTGRIVRIKGEPLELERIRADQRWAFDQDVNLAEIGPAPPDANLSAGRWWPASAPEPQVVLDAEVADAAGLKVGDVVTLQLLGRELDLRVAGLRDAEFGSFGTSYNVIVNPAAVAGANLRHVAIAKADAAQERALLRSLGRDFPMVNVISVREQLEAATRLFDQLTLAVRGAAAVATLAGLLVLAGALSATAAPRAREAAIFKVLGADRREILAAYGIEYGCVGAIAGLTGVALAVAATYPLVTQIFEAKWSLDWQGLIAIVAGVAGLTAAGGVAAAFVALAKRPAATLRSD